MGDYVAQRNRDHFSLLSVWRTEKQQRMEDNVDSLWSQIKNLAKNNWDDEGFILRPYIGFEGILAEAVRQNLPRFVLPPHEPQFIYPKPFMMFRLFKMDEVGEEDGAPLPANDSIGRFIVEENLTTLFFTYYRERKECATRLLSYSNKSKVPIYHMIVEVIFSYIFRVPTPIVPDICFATIFIELCKLQPQFMPQVLALATELIFEKLDDLTRPTADRFTNWFAHHLSNFQFRWSWDEWADCLQQDLESSRPAFIREVLEKCRRLCYHQRINETVPQDFEPLLPSEPIIRFKYKHDDDDGMSENPAVACSRKLEYAIRSKATAEEIFDILKDVPKPTEPDNEENPDYNPNALDVFLQTLMFIASKTFSHSFAALSKYHIMLKRLAKNEGAKVKLLQILYDMWKDHPQMIVVLIDKCIRAQIVDPASVAQWIFSVEMSSNFQRYFVWEILHGTISKMKSHVDRVTDEYESIKSRLHQASIKLEEGTEAAETQDMMDSYAAFAPSESEVETFREKLENAKVEQKNLFLVIFQRFIGVISEHVAKHGLPIEEDEMMDTQETLVQAKNRHWLQCTCERLQEVFLRNETAVLSYDKQLSELLFTQGTVEPALNVFKEFRVLHA
ncbi:Oidioi.mRNA.OKI2018_I69.PAR.g11876.t2.cds [Oikopleura dioica]|nr:Oidioi.mRNA.OKI2018_I69.PAR.g11876.t2.cds [Oikopleura dioica]